MAQERQLKPTAIKILNHVRATNLTGRRYTGNHSDTTTARKHNQITAALAEAGYLVLLSEQLSQPNKPHRPQGYVLPEFASIL